MPYSQFTTLRKALEDFSLQLVEQSFFPDTVPPVEPGEVIKSYLDLTLPGAARGSEKVRSEGIIYPILTEVKRIQNERGKPISLFSGEDFTVDSTLGLNGICDFLICRSPLVSIIEAPIIALVEGKKADVELGLGQCVAEMVAALKFNQSQGLAIDITYGVVTTGTLWRFLKLEGNAVIMDLTDYSLMPLSETLGRLMWLVK